MARFRRRGRKSSRTVMQAMLAHCRSALTKGVRRTRADRYVKKHGSVSLALALVCYFVLGLSSLRGLQRRVAQEEQLAGWIGWMGMSVSQLSKSLHARPPELWQALVELLSLQARGSGLPGWLRVMDSSLFKLSGKLLTRCTGKGFKNPGNAGIHATMVLDGIHLTPLHLHSKVGQGGDAGNGPAALPPDESIEGHLYLFDRGFRNYGFFDEVIERKADFITRQSSTIHYEVLQTFPLDPKHPEIISDEKVQLGAPNAKNRMKNSIRRIVLKTEGEPVIFLTSCFTFSAFEVTELYRQRWIVETFFRWLKRVIGCNKPLGYSRKAAEHAIYAALVVYLLTLLFLPLVPAPPKIQKTAQIKAAFELLGALLYQRPKRDFLQALGFA